MIHQVKPPLAAVAKLKQIVKLQLLLLDHAVEQPVVDAASIATCLAEAYGTEAAKVAKWVAHKGTWLAALNQFAAHTDHAAKRNLVAGIRADIQLLYTPAPQRLQITIPKDAPNWKLGVREFCLHFFELWRAETKEPGFPSQLFPLDNDAQSFTRWDYLDAFRTANDGLYLCAICDTSAYRTTVGNRIFASIEHFFPKSYYPHLAIHPYNLVPICPFCNSRAGDKDIMTYCDEALGIAEILLPYSQAHSGFTEQAFVEIRPRISSGEIDREKIHPLHIKFRPAKNYQAERALYIFNETYGIEERWNNDLDQIGEHVFRRIQQFLLGDVHAGNSLTDHRFLLDKIKMLMALTERQDLGKDPYGFATVWLLNYFVDRLEQDQENALIYLELKQWAEMQREDWHTLTDYADQIRTRVPVLKPATDNEKI
ncbi:MAG: hypothetical protein R3C14_00375 [Caldilineaceae bacterium]